MGLKRITAPAEEPVSLAEARDHLRSPSGQTGQDARIQAMIIAARGHAETFTGRAFITQTWDWAMDSFPCDAVELPHAPLQSITSITYIDTAGATQVLAGSSYQVDIVTDPGRLMPAYGTVWPSTRSQTFNAVTIRFVCGYGLAAAVPQEIKAAMLLIVGHLYEHREENADFELFQMPLAAERLLMPYRSIRF